MKELTLKLPGTVQITAPQEIQHFMDRTNPYGGNIFGTAINLLFVVAALMALGFIVYGGIKIITSEGDPKNIDAARKTIIYAIVGLGLVFFSYLIINVLGHFLGIDLLNGNGGSPGPC